MPPVPTSLPKPLADVNARLKHACEGPDLGENIPNVAAVAADKHGKIIHSSIYGSYNAWPAPEARGFPKAPSPSTPTTIPESKASSTKSPESGVLGAEMSAPQPFTADTVCWMASLTKLMATVAALQCVEKGLLHLDKDISHVLPEFKNPDILVKMDEEKGPILKKAKKHVSLRHMLTHSNGTAYDFSHPKTAAYRSWLFDEWRAGSIPRPTDPVERAFAVPLLFEPGEGWSYGYGTDWAGIAVARAAKMPLEEYMKKNIWGPLGMDSTTFFPYSRPDLFSRLAGVVVRGEGGKLEPSDPDSVWARPPQGWPESGGGGCYGTANDYIKLLISLLKNDGKVLKPKTRDLMFKEQLHEPKHLQTIHANPLSFGLAGNIPQTTPVSYGYGGIINLEDIERSGRSKGTLQWSGLPNLFWWINPTDGVCGCYFGQLLPPGDPVSFAHYEAFETAVNESIKGPRKGSKL